MVCMGQRSAVYITGCGAYLPGEPVGNEQIADHLGGTDPATARRRARVLAANGIRQRHYAVGPGGGGPGMDGRGPNGERGIDGARQNGEPGGAARPVNAAPAGRGGTASVEPGSTASAGAGS